MPINVIPADIDPRPAVFYEWAIKHATVAFFYYIIFGKNNTIAAGTFKEFKDFKSIAEIKRQSWGIIWDIRVPEEVVGRDMAILSAPQTSMLH